MKQGARVAIFLLVMSWITAGPLFGQESGGLTPGWLSLDSTAGQFDNAIQTGKSNLEKYLFGVKVSGFIDTSYTWSSNHPGFPNDDDMSLRVFNLDHNQILFNDFNLTLERPEPEKGWGVGGKLVGDFGRTGELLREATLWGSTTTAEPSVEIREAFLTTTLPVGKGIGIQGGLFVTLLGTEIIPNPGAYNDNISRSYLFGFSIPFRHLGIMFSYPVHDRISASAGLVTGWDNPKDNNGQPSFLGGVTLSPTKNFSLNSSLVIGPEQDNNSGNKRLAWANVASWTPMEPMTVTAEYTYGHEEKVTTSGRDATWQGIAGYVSYNWTDRVTSAIRGEFFRDHDGARFGGDIPGKHMDVKAGEITLTGTYKFTQMLLGRMEFRQDWANQRVFLKGNTASDKNQTTLALEAVYTF